MEIFAADTSEFPTKSNFVSLKTKNFNFIEGYIQTSYGEKIEEKDYAKHLTDIVLPYSTADSFTFDGKDYMVGALARINQNKDELHKNTKRDAKEYLKLFPSSCVFKANLAQAIEMLHCVDQSIELLETTKFKIEKIPEIKPRDSIGTGVVEAPRGTLYHHYKIDKNGIIQEAELVIPTGQNIIKIEKDIVSLINMLLPKMKKEQISLEVERLIRAFDPCMNCATHFLKINWES
jgi:coenzyme F420-reducing hydrogenase alpha subunit